VLCTGVERAAGAPFFAGGKWRFVERVAWWNQYTEDVPVIVGHYWRRHRRKTRCTASRKKSCSATPRPRLGMAPGAMCSVWTIRWAGAGSPAVQASRCSRASSWRRCAGQRDLVFDDGTVLPTLAFQDTAQAL
jgi:hypothetical protein